MALNLHRVASGAIAAVNPQVLVGLQVSIGAATLASGKQVPAYATPGSLVGSIAGDVLTVTAVSAGKLAVGQALAGAGLLPGTSIFALGTGTGGAGTYQIAPGGQTVASEAMTTSLSVEAQVQALTFRDIQQVEGLNLQGTQRAMYLYGDVEGLVRPTGQGGDLITMADATVWLVTHVLETWPGWCKVAVTLQNEGS